MKTNTNNTPEFIVHDAAANMPSSCKYGPYKNVYVLRLVGPVDYSKPLFASPRCRQVEEVVESWPRLWAGGVQDAHARALREASELADELNKRARRTRQRRLQRRLRRLGAHHDNAGWWLGATWLGADSEVAAAEMEVL